MLKKVIFTDRTNSLLNSYLRDISRYKILESSEINDLIKKAQAGDDIARKTVINSNLRFVVTVAKQFQGRGIPLMDLISSGNEGLMRSIDKFDSEKGVTFLSYAIWWIKQAIYKSIYWEGREIRLPLSQQALVNSIAEAIETFMKHHNRYPSSVEISEKTNIPVEQIDFLAQYSNKLVSVDDFIGGDEENNQLCDIIPDNEEPLEDVLNKEYLNKELVKVLDLLPIREHDILCMLFGINMPKVSSKVVAGMLGIGSERVRQLKEKALNRLRTKYANKINKLL